MIELTHMDHGPSPSWSSGRLIAATAKSLDLTLVTADRRLIDCRDIRVLAV
ncbi:MAG: hypothetical protein OXH37_00740 [Gammaproteobacteria bacterium]|nr:hypothetical protein [Gammaproteobacteria bacterium]